MSATDSQPVAPEAVKPAGPGRPKDLGKRAAILDVAKRLFSQNGFDGVSMDQIAAEAGVSKLTVYSHFGDKESLFSSAIRAKCEEQMPPTLFLAGLEGNLREQLTTIARAASQFFCLIKGEMHMQLLCGMCCGAPVSDTECHIEATVDLFLRAYGSDRSAAE